MNTEDLSEEQKNKIDELNLKYAKKSVITCLLYLGSLLPINFLAGVINALYIQNNTLLVLVSVGFSVVTLAGLQGSLNEQAEELHEEIGKVLNGRG